MTQRSYTIKEIDDMRRAVEVRYIYGIRQQDMKPGVVYSSRVNVSEADKISIVEEMVRTYMVAGVDPKEVMGL